MLLKFQGENWGVPTFLFHLAICLLVTVTTILLYNSSVCTWQRTSVKIYKIQWVYHEYLVSNDYGKYIQGVENKDYPDQKYIDRRGDSAHFQSRALEGACWNPVICQYVLRSDFQVS